ncbi:MAG TPA: carotenoid 1,2-hydratase, partial [Candidatus Eisenbacteria bacterium]|nr:carotenoid 1,2-hydratase [Candidatus Eisenbacteria bacterium]
MIVPQAGATRRRGWAGLAGAFLFTLGACGGAPLLANPPLAIAPPPTAPATAAPPPDPVPIELPRDDGPHHRLTEWWYYTGHLVADDGRHFGFEAVIFRAERGDLPVSWASHLALTDEAGNRFLYAQRSEIGATVDRSPVAGGQDAGFDLAISGLDPTIPESLTRSPWQLAGSDGFDRIEASLSPQEATAAGGTFGLTLDLGAQKPPALHDHDGWIDFDGAGGSYYYSRTRMAATGTLSLDGASVPVTGIAWFDHQWGDFISVGGGGWDWFAVNLDDGSDLTLSLVRTADGSSSLVYGTFVEPGGRTEHLDRDAFTAESSGSWTSPTTGAVYPSGWRVRVPSQGLELTLTPTLD